MNNEIKHTPGPWKVGCFTDNGIPSHVGIFQNDAIPGDTVLAICAISPIGQYTKDDEKNAQLIAAAPEMLEALEACMRIRDLWYPGENWPEHEASALAMMEDYIKSSIKKAKGL